jgi:hypothetical protein
MVRTMAELDEVLDAQDLASRLWLRLPARSFDVLSAIGLVLSIIAHTAALLGQPQPFGPVWHLRGVVACGIG